MTVRCITNKHGFSMLVTTVEVFSTVVEAFSVDAVVDTGASVALVSPELLARLSPTLSDRKMTVHGLLGKTQQNLFTFGVRAGDYSRGDCVGIGLTGKFMGHDLVLGLDVLLQTGLTLTPGGEHRLAV